MAEQLEPSLDDVLASAARLQDLVPGAVLVGGSAAVYHARHRLSFDHDHVISDLADRFETILEHLEALGDWSTARVQAGKLILGTLGGIESGIRQLRRSRPLEVEAVDIDGRPLHVPTAPETLRVKAWLAITRNQVRDYVDVAGLADLVGVDTAARTLVGIDRYYADIYVGEDRVATQVARQLADPEPRDGRMIIGLATYRQLDPRWHDWDAVVAMTRQVAVRMLDIDS